MTITSSVILEDHAQPNGERDIWERHTFDDDYVVDVRYRVAGNFDASAAMAARVASLEQERTDEADASTQLALRVSIDHKFSDYLIGLPDITLTTIVGLTSDELAVVQFGG